jgi:hypothetical protein
MKQLGAMSWVPRGYGKMNERTFRVLSLAVAIGFAVVFTIVVIPPLIENPDVLGAFSAGFVNPYASGYSSDVIFCWIALAIWVTHEATTYNVRYGWVCLVLGLVPGVAVGFALYLILRSYQITQLKADA